MKFDHLRSSAWSLCQIILILHIGCIYFIEKPCMSSSSSEIQIVYATWKCRFELILSLHIACLCSVEIRWSPMFCFWRWGGWCTLYASCNILYVFNSNTDVSFKRKTKEKMSHKAHITNLRYCLFTLQKVGFIGLGNMGSHMANNLMKAGYQLVVHDL